MLLHITYTMSSTQKVIASESHADIGNVVSDFAEGFTDVNMQVNKDK